MTMQKNEELDLDAVRHFRTAPFRVERIIRQQVDLDALRQHSAQAYDQNNEAWYFRIVDTNTDQIMHDRLTMGQLVETINRLFRAAK